MWEYHCLPMNMKRKNRASIIIVHNVKVLGNKHCHKNEGPLYLSNVVLMCCEYRN